MARVSSPALNERALSGVITTVDTVIETLTQSSAFMAAAVAGFVVALGLIWFFIASTDRRTLCVGYVLLAFLFEVFIHKQPYFQLGLQIYPNDLLSLLLLACMVMGTFTRPLPLKEGALLIWLALGACILTSFAIGLGRYGTAAGTEVREYFYYWAVGLFCCTADFDEPALRRIGRWALWTAYGLIGIALYRWIGVAVGLVPASLLREVGVTSDFRALPSHAALYLSVAALVATMAWLRGTGGARSGLHAFIFTAFVLILQHRSVWIAHLVGLLYLAFQERDALPRRFPWILAFLLIGGISVGIAAIFGYLDPLFEALWASTISVIDSQSSVTDRVFGWESLVADWASSSIGTLLLGFPYGHGWRRVIDGRVIEFSPHNFYVDMLLRVGLVGVAILLWANVMATVHSLRAKVTSEVEYLLLRGMGVILVVAFVYYVPYTGHYVLGAVTGLALAQIIRLRRRAAASADRAATGWRPAAGRIARG